MKKLSVLLVLVVLVGWAWTVECRAGHLVDWVSVWGEATDFMPGGDAANINRLGGFGSDIHYDQANHFLYSIPDRGPGGGGLPFQTKLQKFSLDVDPVTGALSGFQLIGTIPFKTADGSQGFNGQLTSDPAVLGLSFDPEGLAMTADGKIYVADEYGPSLYEFSLTNVGGAEEARFVRAFAVPDRYVPRDANGSVNYLASTSTVPALARGRQSGRGFEGLTLSPDGSTLWATMQDPFVNEYDRRGRNVRIARFDVATGVSTGEYVGQLESVADINLRLPDGAKFAATQQGRNISWNEVLALSDHELLVLERDNRGVGTANPLNTDPVLSHVGTKRVYKIDLTGATDVSGIDLSSSSNDLPPGVMPVSKQLFFDIQAAIEAWGLASAEKLEGIALLPLTGEQPFALLVSADNDFSVVDVTDPVTGEVQLFDILTDGTRIPMDSPRPEGTHLLPSYVYSFAVPEPSTMVMLLAGALAAALTVIRRARPLRHK